MAQRIVTTLIDDLTGTESEDIETVVFSLKGCEYEIDLTGKNREKLEKAFGPFVDKARRVGKGGTGGTPRKADRRSGKGSSSKASSNGARPDTSAVRQWAQNNGFTVSDRGRISAEIIAAYQKAH